MSKESENARAALVETLLKKIDEDTYPSTTMLNLLEELLTEEELPAYAMWLRQRIENDKYPSIPMIDRLVSIARPA